MTIATTTPAQKRPVSRGYKTPIALRLDDEDEDAVREIAKEDATSVTTVCRQAVREFIAKKGYKSIRR